MWHARGRTLKLFKIEYSYMSTAMSRSLKFAKVYVYAQKHHFHPTLCSVHIYIGPQWLFFLLSWSMYTPLQSTLYSILWNACCSWAAGTGAEELLSTQQDVASEKIIAYSVFYIIKFTQYLHYQVYSVFYIIKFTQYFTLSSLLSILHCKFFSVFYIIKFAMYFTLYPFLLNFFYCFLHSNFIHLGRTVIVTCRDKKYVFYTFPREYYCSGDIFYHVASLSLDDQVYSVFTIIKITPYFTPKSWIRILLYQVYLLNPYFPLLLSLE